MRFYMMQKGDKYIISVIKKSIRKVGDYEASVRIEVIDFLGGRVYSYKIDNILPLAIREKINTSIKKPPIG